MTPELHTDLERVVDYFTRQARKADADKAVAELAGNECEAQKFERHRVSHLKAADRVRAAIRLLQKRQSNGAFVPPTLIEVIAFAKEHEDIKGRWPIADIKSWWNHFQTVGWLVGKGKKMKDWEAAALNGFKNWLERNPAKLKTVANEDPAGWVEYLKGIGRDWMAYRYAPEHLRVDFRKGSD